MPSPASSEKPTLEQLIANTRDVYSDTTAQIRDIGELAFMEFELAIKSLQWGIVALLLLGMSGVMAFAFLMVATVMLLKSTMPPAVVMLICGGFSAVVACLLYLWLRTLTKKLTFQNLRRHLTQANER